MILPFFFDQGFWGHRLAASGLGPPPIPFRHLSAAALAQALDAADQSPDMRCRLQRLSVKLRREDGVATAVAIIENALKRFGK